MIWLSICFFLALFANANSEATADPDPNKPPLKVGETCDIQSLNQIVCENDTLIFCGPTNKITSSPCIIGGRQAFCNCEKTDCVAEKPICGEVTDCLTPKTKLPDNLNCHKFSYCNEKNKKVILQCPGELVYDPNTKECTDRGSARCARVVCPRKSNSLSLIPFPQARNYYVLCFQGVGDVRKCADEFYAVRNNAFACQFDCKMKKKVGLFRDTNLQKCRDGFYYACKKSGGSYVTIPAKCQEGMYFDEKIGVCTETDTCQQESTNPPQQ